MSLHIHKAEALSEDTPHYHPLLIVLAAASAGIAADYYWPQSLAVWSAVALAALGIWYPLARMKRHRAAAGSIFLAILCLAGAWHHCRWDLFDENDLGNFTAAKKQPVALEAVALDSPSPLPPPETGLMQSPRSGPTYRMEISAAAIRDADQWKPASGRAMLYIQGDAPAVEAGDKVRVFGELSAPAPAHNPGEFDRAAYLRRHRIRAVVQSQTDAICMVRPGSRWNLTRLLEGVRKKSGELFRHYLDPRQAELASAIFLGEREQIDYDRNEAFMVTGTIHILSISGLHVGILAGAVFWLTRWLPIPRICRLTLVALITGLYALMVDVNPPVVRATILVLITCLSIYMRRPALSFNSLAAAALVVLAVNPCDLFNVGAQLSFLSVAAIMWAWPHRFPLVPISADQDHLRKMVIDNLDPVSRFVHKSAYYVWELAFIGFIIWMLTQPLIAARFHILSPIGLVLNIFTWIPATLGLLGGFVFLFLCATAPPLAGIAAYFCNLMLWLMEKIIALGAAVPGSHFWVSGPSDWWLAGFYGGLAVLAAVPRIRPSPRRCAALLAGWIALGLAVSYARHDSNRLHCTFLSVGHGSAAVLELPSGKTLLYDAGQLGSPDHAARIISGFLWSRGINRIDAVVVSHPDADHYNALPEVLEKFSIGAAYVSPIMFKSQSAALTELKSAFDKARVPVREVHAGDRLDCDANCRLEVLHPPQSAIPDNDNANSVVLAAEYRGHCIILPGDLESPGLDVLLAGQPVRCDVLLAPHHGSKQSNSPGLAAWTKPAWVVFSGDGQWTLPEIDATYQAAGAQTLHTFISGAVETTIDKNGAAVKTFLDSKWYEK
jgi:competence protein ComEC